MNMRLLLVLLISAALLVPAETKNADPKCFGSSSAPIVLEVFSDYQCPACRQLYLETLKKVMTDCVSTGKVYLVHHDFPLSMHKYAREAARYANAAARIHKFETVSDELFQKQPAWS